MAKTIVCLCHDIRSAQMFIERTYEHQISRVNKTTLSYYLYNGDTIYVISGDPMKLRGYNIHDVIFAPNYEDLTYVALQRLNRTVGLRAWFDKFDAETKHPNDNTPVKEALLKIATQLGNTRSHLGNDYDKVINAERDRIVALIQAEVAKL